MKFRDFIENTDITFDNFKDKLNMIADAVLKDVEAVNDLKAGNSVRPSILTRLFPIPSGLASVISSRLNDVLRNNPTVTSWHRKVADEAALKIKDGYLYHVTTNAYIKYIKSHGLTANVPQRNFEGWYSGYSKGKVFFCERGGVGYWSSKIQENHENLGRSGKIRLVVLRVKRELLPDLKADSAGTGDSRHPSYYVEHDVPWNDIEVVK